MRTFCIALFALLLWVSSCSGQEVEDDLEESLFEEAFQPSIEQSSSKENAEGRKGKKKPGKKIISPPPPPSGSDQQQQEGPRQLAASEAIKEEEVLLAKQRAAVLNGPGRPAWVIAVAVISAIVLVAGLTLIVIGFNRSLKMTKTVEEVKANPWGPRIFIAAGVLAVILGALGLSLPLILVTQ